MKELRVYLFCFLFIAALLASVALFLVSEVRDTGRSPLTTQQPSEGEEGKAPPTFLSATECIGADGKPAHGTWRWQAKTESGWDISNPETMTIADLAGWKIPNGITGTSPRLPQEKRVVKVRGKWVILKPEDDSDFHLQLADPDGQTDVQLVVEIPMGNSWNSIREKVAELGELTFPCKPHEKKLDGSITLEVTGPIFLDAFHQGQIPNRRSYDPRVMVVEIHPVQSLTVLDD